MAAFMFFWLGKIVRKGEWMQKLSPEEMGSHSKPTDLRSTIPAFALAGPVRS
jgi:hypothetical protein